MFCLLVVKIVVVIVNIQHGYGFDYNSTWWSWIQNIFDQYIKQRFFRFYLVLADHADGFKDNWKLINRVTKSV